MNTIEHRIKQLEKKAKINQEWCPAFIILDEFLDTESCKQETIKQNGQGYHSVPGIESCKKKVEELKGQGYHPVYVIHLIDSKEDILRFKENSNIV